MDYYIYLKTFYTPYEQVKHTFKSLEEVNSYLDSVSGYEVYQIIGYGKGQPTYTDMGYFDRPKSLVKTPKKLF